MAPTTGFSSIQGNFPATVQNKGLEIELNTRNITTKNVSWTTSLNISIPRNKLVAFPDIQAFPAYANTLVVGEALSIRKRYHFTGINTTTGVYEFEDIDGNGSIDFQDQQIIRFIGQKFSGGLQNSLQYKGFQLDILFQFVKQSGVSYLSIFDAPGGLGNQPVVITGRWQKAGDNSTIQRYTTGSSYTAFSRFAASDQSIVDASFIRLKNLSVSYSLPQHWLKKLHSEEARLFVHAQNLLTITDYGGLDPETQNNILPPLRVITAGIHLTF